MCWGILLKIKRDSQLSKIDHFFFGNANIAKIYSRFLSTIIPQRKGFVLVRSTKSNPVGRGQYLDGYPPGNTSFCTLFFFFNYTIEVFWLFQNMSFVLSSERENQIVVTIGTMLHHIHVEF